MADAPDEGLSAYELQREENIRQNNLRLHELGLDHSSVPVSGRTNRAASSKRPRPAGLSIGALPTEGVRRSQRHRVVVTPYTDDTPLPQSHRTQALQRKPYEAPDDDDDDDDDRNDEAGAILPGMHKEPIKIAERPPPTPGSSVTIRLDASKILEEYLGRQIPGPSTKLSAVTAMSGRANVRFSKYSGSLEWKNAVVLWVNIGGTDYKNVFLDGGRQMTWYASERNHEGTPVVQRLTSTNETVLLFCRLPGEPYICCGRLAYVSHVPSRRPLKFLWKLLDLPALNKSNGFKELLSFA